MSDSSFWQHGQTGIAMAKRSSQLAQLIGSWQRLHEDTINCLQIAQEDLRDQTTSLTEELNKQYHRILAEVERQEFQLLFDGKYDESAVILSIHAGSGGTEAMDWAEMLERMITRFSTRRGFRVQEIDRHRGDVAGIKSLTMEIQGEYAYGWLKGEAGVHRLVRVSPFDAEQMRHTSFALIDVLPEFEEIQEMVIDPKDLRIDTYLSSGHGGQSVQTTYSAVRVVHLPTGLMASCQNERSQLQNKEIALNILKAKLLKLQIEQQQKERNELRGEVVSAEWGNQIRSYVLHPYKLVKDHRTGYETQDPYAVLEGDLGRFEEEYLKWRKTHNLLISL